MVAAECTYKEIDCQLKEQFIHGLNNKNMLDEVIRELTTKTINELMTSEDMLIWAKMVEVQRVQAAILSDITESQKFNKVKVVRQQATHPALTRWPCRYSGSCQALRQCLAYGKMCAGCRKMGHFKKVCQSRKDRGVHEVEVQVPQEECKIEEVSINSVYLNNKQSLITGQLEMQVSDNTIKVPYKIDTGSEGDLMLLYILKKLFRNKSVEQLKRSIKGNIKLKTYNGTHIQQLGMCAVTIKFKNLKKQCVFFVVPGNCQALLGMPDMAVLNIINLNIDSIQKEIRNCKANRGQELHTITEDCTNKDVQSAVKQDDNGPQHHSQANTLINYFYESDNTVPDKNKSSAMTRRIHETFGDVFNGIECFKGTFSLQLKPDSKTYQMPLRHIAYALQQPFKEELQCLQELDIIVPLGVDEMAEWCNWLCVGTQSKCKVWLCLDPAQLNQALNRQIHRGPMLNNILPKLNNLQYMSIINASLGYHNLKLDK